MAKQVPEPSLHEVLAGVDIIGTILNTDLPRLERELGALRADLTRSSVSGESAAASSRKGPDDMSATLEEIRDLLQLQLDRLDALERRVAHLAALCTPAATEHSESGEPRR